MASKDQHKGRVKIQKLYADLNNEEYEDAGDIYDNLLMFYLLASNDGGSKMMFSGEKKEEWHRVWNNMDRYILLPLDNYHIKRAYKIDTLSFYKWNSIIETQLKGYPLFVISPLNSCLTLSTQASENHI